MLGCVFSFFTKVCKCYDLSNYPFHLKLQDQMQDKVLKIKIIFPAGGANNINLEISVFSLKAAFQLS